MDGLFWGMVLLDLVRSGRKCLEAGELLRAKSFCRQISIYLDMYLASEEEWRDVELFLKEVLLIQKLAEWRAQGKQEYFLLEEAALREVESTLEGVDLGDLEKYF